MARFGIFQSGGPPIGEEGTLCVAHKGSGSCFVGSQVLSAAVSVPDAKNQLESLGAGECASTQSECMRTGPGIGRPQRPSRSHCRRQVAAVGLGAVPALRECWVGNRTKAQS